MCDTAQGDAQLECCKDDVEVDSSVSKRELVASDAAAVESVESSVDAWDSPVDRERRSPIRNYRKNHHRH